MIKKWLKKLVGNTENGSQSSPKKLINGTHFNGSINQIQLRIREIFGNSTDLVIEAIHLGGKDGLVCYLRTLTDWDVVTTKILHPIREANLAEKEILSEEDWLIMGKSVFSGTQHQFIHEEKEIIEAIINGQAVIFTDKMKPVLAMQIVKVEQRGIEEPTTQTIVRGPKEGFNENVETNLSLMRKKIKNPALRFEEFTIGTDTSTKVYLGYMDGIINKGILNEIQTRLKAVKTNAILESGTLEEFITDKTFTPFPLLYNTERPDTIAAHLLEGKFAIFVDGSPFVLSAPSVFGDFLSVSEDHYQPFSMGSFVRLIRYFSFLITMFLPAFFIALITYHHELIPTALIISIISQREGIPFPAVIELLIMEITFEILREAGVRMPRAVGGTISIVGGLVIGQAAVEAGIVSNIMVIVVALTAIASFVTPIYTFAIASRLLRFVFILLASVFGLYGVFLGMIMMVGHLASLRSFSVPYLAPFAPFKLQDHKDTIIRLPGFAMKQRPSFLETETPAKQPMSNSPSPSEKGEDGI